MPSLIEVLESQVDVDVDTMDPAITKSLPFKPHDMTSNQIIVYERMTAYENREMIAQAVREYKDLGGEKIYDRICALLCAKNIENIQGRVLLQVSPSHAYDTDKVLAHARSYAEELEKVGIPRERFCIKIPCTGPALVAGKQLREEGIRTLGTALFSLAQAIAASQAGCLYISPYYNEVRAHVDPSAWPDVADPATEHPMSPRILHILSTYHALAEACKEPPIMKAASFLSVKEVLACAEMGCQGLTIPPAVLRELCTTPATSPLSTTPKPAHPSFPAPPARLLPLLAQVDPYTSSAFDKGVSTEVDYLAEGGKVLDRANESDPVVWGRLGDALVIFKTAEGRSREVIERLIRVPNWKGV